MEKSSMLPDRTLRSKRHFLRKSQPESISEGQLIMKGKFKKITGKGIHHVTRPEPLIYKPIGYCIYCGASKADAKLTREHVLPLGLDGGFILPESSCESCSKITGQFEQICLRENFGLYRRHIKLSSGRHKPSERPLVVEVRKMDGSVEEKLVSTGDYPTLLTLPTFDAPGIFNGITTQPLIARFETKLNALAAASLEEKFGGKVNLRCNFDLISFARMLAKIAHAMTVGEIGRENFSPLALDLILGKDTGIAGGLIGQTMWYPSDRLRPTLHHISFHLIPFGDRHLVGAGIQLFGNVSTTMYTAIAGKLTPTPSILNWKGMSNFTSGSLESFIKQYGLGHH